MKLNIIQFKKVHNIYIILMTHKQKQQLKQLLHIYKIQLNEQQSWFGKLFKFENSQFAINFQKKYSIFPILTTRFDDVIYLILLLTVLVFFAVYNYINMLNQTLANAFQQYCIMLFIGSFLWLVVPHWYNKYIALPTLYILFPVFVFLIFNNQIQLDPINRSTQINTYFGILCLPVVYLELLLVYPLKQYIRNKIGTIYSYLYALSLIFILFLWPLHQILMDLQSFNLLFLSNNIGIIYTIWAIILLFIYLYIHERLCLPKHESLKQILLQKFTEQQIANFNQNSDYFFIKHYKLFARFVSFIIFSIYCSIQIYFLKLLIDYIKLFSLSNILQMLFMILYVPIFLLMGSFIVHSKLSNKYLFIILSIISIIPSCMYPFFYTSNNTINLILLAVGPFTIIFWLIIKSINKINRILHLKALFYLYTFFYIPAIGFAMNSFYLFTTDIQQAFFINLATELIPSIAAAIVILYYMVLTIIFIYGFVQQNKKKIIVEKILDYNYFEEGEVDYIPYKKTQQFSLQGLIEADLISFGYLFNSIIFIGCQIVTIYGFNYVISNHQKQFFSNNIDTIMITQFIIVFIVYICFQMHITIEPYQQIPYFISAFFILTTCVSLILVAISFFVSQKITFVSRLLAILLILVIILFGGLLYLKNSNTKIHKFLSPVTSLMIWILAIIPFFVAIPFISIFVSDFGQFMYDTILASTILIILVVAIITFIFNSLMNRFQQQKKIKYIIGQVRQLLNQQGIDADDNVLNRFYESYTYRDIKYIFFLKKGFPVNVYESRQQSATLVTMQAYQQFKQIQKKESDEQFQKKKQQQEKKQLQNKKKQKKTYCLAFLDCLFGDDQTIQQKIQEIVQKKKVKRNFVQQLMPLTYYQKGFRDRQDGIIIKKHKVISNLKKQEFVSTKTIFLREMIQTKKRYVTDYYQNLKVIKRLRVQLWHLIFDFFANQDFPPKKIIFNDLKIFIQKSGIDVDVHLIQKLYDQYATQEWGQMYSLNQKQFAIVMNEVCEQRVQQCDYETKLEGLLMEVIYPNLNKLRQFRDFSEQYYKKERFGKINIDKSPFVNFKKLKQKIEFEKKVQKLRYNEIRRADHEKKIFDQVQIQQKEQIKQQSCKKVTKQKIFSCWSLAFQCFYTSIMYLPNKIKQYFKSNKQQHNIVKRRIKPWQILSVQCVKLIETAEIQYSKGLVNQYTFRYKFDNFLPAAMKLLDLYYFVSLSLSDPSIPWSSSNAVQSPNNGGQLYNNYVILFWLSIALTFVYLFMSLKAVVYIAEGRFGLTQTGAEASFPHPMFFFTNIYKSLSLSLFSFIMTNIYDTFNCTWNSDKFTLIRLSDLTCLQSKHTIYMISAIIGMTIYYPISAYVMPNFQFAQKTLDLKYKPSYLVLYFQCKLILVTAGVLLANSDSKSYITQLIYISIIIAVLIALSFSIINTMPCMIQWFNYVDLIILLASLIFNIGGLVLYLTNQWLGCIIGVCGMSLILIIVSIIFIRGKYFNKKSAQQQNVDNEELILRLQYQQKRHLKIRNKELQGRGSNINFNGENKIVSTSIL